MSAAKFYIEDDDLKLIQAQARDQGLSFSEFVRTAAMEKVSRDQLVSQVEDVRSEIGRLVSDLRQEQQLARRELADEAARALEAQRVEAAASLKRFEELSKVLVLELARKFDQPAAPQRRHDIDDLSMPSAPSRY